MRRVVRTSAPPLAEPGRFFATVAHDLSRAPALAKEIARRELRAQYRQSLLRSASVPLPVVALTLAALGFQQAGMFTADAAGAPYLLFVLLGAVSWTTFLDALHAPIHGLLADHRLLLRTSAPPEALILGRLGPIVFNLGLKVVLVVAALIGYAHPVSIAALLLAPLGLLGLIALGTTVGLILAPLNLVYRDISKLLVTLTTFWFFISPIYFSAPAPTSGPLGLVMHLNPVTPLLDATRDLVLGGRPVALGTFFALLTAVLLATMVAWLFVRIALPVVLGLVNE